VERMSYVDIADGDAWHDCGIVLRVRCAIEWTVVRGWEVVEAGGCGYRPSQSNFGGV